MAIQEAAALFYTVEVKGTNSRAVAQTLARLIELPEESAVRQFPTDNPGYPHEVGVFTPQTLRRLGRDLTLADAVLRVSQYYQDNGIIGEAALGRWSKTDRYGITSAREIDEYKLGQTREQLNRTPLGETIRAGWQAVQARLRDAF